VSVYNQFILASEADIAPTNRTTRRHIIIR